jgi:hypothetical protein
VKCCRLCGAPTACPTVVTQLVDGTQYPVITEVYSACARVAPSQRRSRGIRISAAQRATSIELLIRVLGWAVDKWSSAVLATAASGRETIVCRDGPTRTLPAIHHHRKPNGTSSERRTGPPTTPNRRETPMSSPADDTTTSDATTDGGPGDTAVDDGSVSSSETSSDNSSTNTTSTGDTTPTDTATGDTTPTDTATGDTTPTDTATGDTTPTDTATDGTTPTDTATDGTTPTDTATDGTTSTDDTSSSSYSTQTSSSGGVADGDATDTSTGVDYKKMVPIPSGINAGLNGSSQATMMSALGNPGTPQDSCGTPSAALQKLLKTDSVGPFRVTGLKPAVDALARVFSSVKAAKPD